MLSNTNLWIKRRESSESNVQDIIDSTGLSPLVVKILVNRGLITEQQINNFLYSDTEKMHDPYLLSDAGIAADRIKKALSRDELICIYGDYDVDGITSTAILYMTLKKMGGRVVYYIPDRIDEGYGMNEQAVFNIKQQGVSLLVTVDCGIRSLKEVDICKELGMDVIITDHHECGDVIPQCTAVVNPKKKGDDYPFKELAGVGVVFKLIQLIDKDIDILDYIDIIALGTVADIVPLEDENRIIVREGLKKLNTNPHPGIGEIIERTGLSGKKITSGHIGFVIAPRFNAAGRVGNVDHPIQLFLGEQVDRGKIAEEMERNNSYRQRLEQETYKKAVSTIEKQGYDKNCKVLVVDGQDWHQGVIGIVASRLVEKYYKPSIVISVKGDIGKGSARSISGFNMVESLDDCKDILEKYGGHEQAAGLTISKQSIGEFRDRINSFAQSNLDESCMVQKYYYDEQIDGDLISLENIYQIEMLSPYGVGNPRPVFRCDDMTIEDIKCFGKDDKHLKLFLSKGEHEFVAIYYGNGHLKDVLSKKQKINILFNLEINDWNGVDNIQLNIKDLKPSIDYFYARYLYTKYFENISKGFISDIIGGKSQEHHIEYKLFNRIDGFIKEEEYLADILRSGNKNLILINTANGIIDFYKFYTKYLQIDELAVSFKWNPNKYQNKNTIVINCCIDKTDFSRYQNIIFYDLCYSMNYLYEVAKKVTGQKIFFYFEQYKEQYNKDVIEDICLNRRYLVNIYNILKAEFDLRSNMELSSLNQIIRHNYHIEQNGFNLICALNIFQELGFLKYDLKDTMLYVYFNDNPSRRNIESSKCYRAIDRIKNDFKLFFTDFKKHVEGESA
ncbi:MAG: single-stranded-DNA-specific exonuclease RecJ [Clostridia bacterium]|nr:single-stranded-DNA-specific exonuclease RecJ [Clostridia bacterium]